MGYICIMETTTKTRDELKANIELLAKEEGKSALEIITALQTGAARLGDEESLKILCDVKWDYIG